MTAKRKPWQISYYKMMDRCCNPNSHKYPTYGGKGITVCDEWLSFDVFLKDMGVRPEKTSLDRIDGSKGTAKKIADGLHQ